MFADVIAVLFWFCVALIVYAYAGYPILLALFARLRPAPGPYPNETPSVTLLIAAHNEQGVIASKLDNCFLLDYPRAQLEILVTDDGSDDRTAEIVRSYADRGVVLASSNERRGKMAAIVRALPSARGDIILLSDANNFYEAMTLRVLTAPFADPTIGAVVGTKAIIQGDGALGESEGLYWRYESFVKMQETRLGCCVGVTGEILAIRRELFEAPPAGIVTEDTYMALRLIRRGHRVVYEPQARSWERISISAQDEIARRARIFAGRYQVLARAFQLTPFTRPVTAWSVISHQFVRTLIGPAMIGAFVTNLLAVLFPVTAENYPLLRLAIPFNYILMACQILFYALAWLGGRVEGKSKLGKALYLPTFLVNSNIAGLIGLKRFLMGRQSVLWDRVARRSETK